MFPDSPKSLVVYVEKGSNGERWAVNNVADWGYQYKILDSVSNLDGVDFRKLYFNQSRQKVRVEESFQSIRSLL